MKTKRTFIAIVHNVPQLFARRSDDYRSVPTIKATVGVLDTEDGKESPRNWSLDYEEPRNSCGGCYASIHVYDGIGNKPEALFGWCGPDISHGRPKDYAHGARACKTIQKKLDALYRANGNTVDAAATMTRWLNVCGVTAVWVRPEGETGTGWLSKGKWDTMTVTEFGELVRSKFPKE